MRCLQRIEASEKRCTWFPLKFTLGGDAAVAVGQLDAQQQPKRMLLMNAEILAWCRPRGIFGGISFTGATTR